MNTGTDRIPKCGELYRHFKDRLYQIVAVAEHSETKETLVIYQALYGDYKVYARPIEMFVSEVDHVKYPAVAQKYRFERVERETLPPTCPRSAAQGTVAQSAQGTAEGVIMQQPERCQTAGGAAQEQDEEVVNPKLLEFFDADTLEEKYNIVVSMRDEVNDYLINSMAVALDVVIPEGETGSRYEELKNCIRTKQRYETQRLR